MRTFSLN